MTTRRTFPAAASLEAALAALRAAPLTADTPLQIEIPLLQAPDPLKWIAAQPAGHRLYWSNRRGHRIAGWGFADQRDVGALTEMRLDDRRWFGGVAFDERAPVSEEWAPFGPGRFWLPRLTVEVTPVYTRLLLHLLPGESIDLSGVTAEEATPVPLPTAVERVSEPPREDWLRHVTAAVGELMDSPLQKVVLSRRTRLRLSATPDAFQLLSRLAEGQVDTFNFGFEVAAGWAFIGCSPELLLTRRGSGVETEALAGTRPRGETAATDAAFAQQLLDSPKEREEHAHVVRAIERALNGQSARITHPEIPQVRRHHRVQHLWTPFEATLLPGTLDPVLLGGLHPTPAVCGQPRAQARAAIRRYEAFSRGWYAGAVGCVGMDRLTLAVGIRAALLRDETLWICAGAGLVQGSQPEAEWRELDVKSAQFIALVGGA